MSRCNHHVLITKANPVSYYYRSVIKKNVSHSDALPRQIIFPAKNLKFGTNVTESLNFRHLRNLDSEWRFGNIRPNFIQSFARLDIEGSSTPLLGLKKNIDVVESGQCSARDILFGYIMVQKFCFE